MCGGQEADMVHMYGTGGRCWHREAHYCQHRRNGFLIMWYKPEPRLQAQNRSSNLSVEGIFRHVFHDTTEQGTRTAQKVIRLN